ncbi:hypothetical protein M8C13_38230 [Crossiella sp. SN42]|uniref:hypothetical protein n=1 Tax=Crossiella sp. SN42 TaxID=2944808 RepID=UPI00207D2CA6|nr:hypothetical protein [Crossiella sp. SN42]MCO1581604.1 hypothetical protein [Crossiella sp. SN42]
MTVSPTTAAPAAPDAKAVAWFDGMCGAVHGYRLANNEHRSKEKSGVTVTKKWLSGELGRLAELAGKTVGELNALAASPVPDGDAAKKTFVDKFAAARDAAAEGKKKLDAGGGQDAALKAMHAAQDHTSEAVDPLRPLKLESHELKLAAARAKACQPTS